MTSEASTGAKTVAKTAAKPTTAAARKPAAYPAPKAASKAAPKAAPKAVAKPKAAPKTTKATAKPAPKAVPKAAPKATPQLKASATAAAKRTTPAAPRPARPSRARAPKVAPALLERLVAAARKSLEDDKAENLVVLDVTGRADYADRLVIATGLADRQIQAMAAHLEDAFEKEGLKLRRDAIQASPDWVLIDAGDLVVHLFKPEARGLYGLERMWGPDSPAPDQDRTPLPDDGAGGSTATEDDDE
jgi:ribosome silencing factor RsfS/YbeB/iojap